MLVQLVELLMGVGCSLYAAQTLAVNDSGQLGKLSRRNRTREHLETTYQANAIPSACTEDCPVPDKRLGLWCPQ